MPSSCNPPPQSIDLKHVVEGRGVVECVSVNRDYPDFTLVLGLESNARENVLEYPFVLNVMPPLVLSWFTNNPITLPYCFLRGCR